VRLRSLEAVEEQLRHENERNAVENERKGAELGGLRAEVGQLRPAFAESQTAISALYAEIHRLQSLLDLIYQSRTWKLHAMVEKMRGRE
jgi:hypothetical protein